MEALQNLENHCTIPTAQSRVYKDECAFSFDNPESTDGLFICLKTFLGMGKKFVESYFRKTGNRLFLQYKICKRWKRKPEEEVPGKRTKLALGKDGGFDLPQDMYTLEESYSLCLLPEWQYWPLPQDNLPRKISESISGVSLAESALMAEEKAAASATWEAESRKISIYAENLKQLDNNVKVPPSGWVCCKCDLKENLWLNLTDGAILCGRKFWDGSGGNNHAVEHYEATKFPLAVKLGTITPQGADVFSYAEDDMVIDPLLPQHIAHFGIDIMRMEKTDKTMTEMEIQLNEQFGEWITIQEANCQLEPLYGPRLTGMRNLGNSCYVNSVMQVLFCIPDFYRRYVVPYDRIMNESLADPANDFRVQMCKLGSALISGEYSKPPPNNSSPAAGDLIPPPPGIRPQMFKLLVGRGHAEFSSKRQQDAQEFLLRILSLVENEVKQHPEGLDPTESLAYQIESRIQCSVTKQVRYITRKDYTLSLAIPLNELVNVEEFTSFEQKKKELEQKGEKVDPAELVRPKIPFQACLDMFSRTESIDDYQSPALDNQKVQALKTNRFATFPDCLWIQMCKFTLGDDWIPRKHDVEILVPDELDLTHLRASGPQPGEVIMKDEETSGINIDQETVDQLVGMGFPLEACRKAVFLTKNSGIESAMNWVMEHMAEPDFNTPIPQMNPKGKPAAFVPNEEALMMLESMGFSRQQATKALKITKNNLEQAADLAFSNPDELNKPDDPEPGQSPSSSRCRDGSGKYKLFAFISHMGTSTQAGHYVCHIKRGDQWVIYNDEKVARSENPPKQLAYIYCFRRVDITDWS